MTRGIYANITTDHAITYAYCATGAIYIFSYKRYFAGICYLWSYPSFEYFRVLPMIVEIAACVKLCGN